MKGVKYMNHIPLRKDQLKKVESIFQWNDGNSCCYSVHLKGNDKSFWCNTLSEVYAVIDGH